MTSNSPLPHVLIIGGGFGGLYAAMALRRATVRVTLIDRCNHHVFSPLVYQVATASLSPADIAQPLRWILRRQKNTRVLLGEAASIDPGRRTVTLADGERIIYDFLIVATGVTHTYFGHDDWMRHAPGLKEVADAIEIRRRFLLAFEAAEREPDAEKRRAILTFVIVGGGPTGVELAGAMAEIARRAMPAEFRAIDTTTARVILLEGRDRILPTFLPELSRRARADLEALGVDVWLNAKVTEIGEQGVSIGGERIVTGNVFWAAGVAASPLGASLGVPLDRAGRVLVNPDLSIPGHPEVFVLGDLALINDPKTGQAVPGVAPAAMQMGRHAARIIASETSSFQAASPKPQADSRPPFRYTDKGMLATIGRNKAVGTVGRVRFTGFVAWFVWLFIHIVYLTGFRNRVIVMIQWAWAYLWFQRGARLITGRAADDLKPGAHASIPSR
jgi:NADH:ubiquinone reductase (H+-translocating)